jgi:hypothetical protein
MAAPPRLTKLGAKWVEVRNGGLGFLSGLVGVIENVASNTRDRRSIAASRSCPNLSQLLLLTEKRQPDRPAIQLIYR